MRKPRNLTGAGFWDGHALWCETAPMVNLKLSAATPAELRRMAAWMLRAAKYAEWAKRTKRTSQPNQMTDKGGK